MPLPIDDGVRAAFEKFDNDSSGDIDAHELPAALDMLGLTDISRDKVEYVMRKYDSDRNATLDIEEVRRRSSPRALLSRSGAGLSPLNWLRRSLAFFRITMASPPFAALA